MYVCIYTHTYMHVYYFRNCSKRVERDVAPSPTMFYLTTPAMTPQKLNNTSNFKLALKIVKNTLLYSTRIVQI